MGKWRAILFGFAIPRKHSQPPSYVEVDHVLSALARRVFLQHTSPAPSWSLVLRLVYVAIHSMQPIDLQKRGCRTGGTSNPEPRVPLENPFILRSVRCKRSIDQGSFAIYAHPMLLWRWVCTGALRRLWSRLVVIQSRRSERRVSLRRATIKFWMCRPGR